MSTGDNADSDVLHSLWHHSMYGHKGEASTERITPKDMALKAFAKPVTTPWDMSVPPSQVIKLINGFSPQSMDDKWIVYADGPDECGNAEVHMHRSWTGKKVAKLSLKLPVDQDGPVQQANTKITDITWESDETLMPGESENSAKETAEGVCAWVMDVKLEKGATPDEKSQ